MAKKTTKKTATTSKKPSSKKTSKKEVAAVEETVTPSKKKEDPPAEDKGTNRLLSVLGNLKGIRVEKASEVRNSFDVRLPTGILGLDIACGGGIPRGGLTEFWGAESAGKSSLCGCLIRQNQRIMGEESRIAVFGIEHELDKGLVRKLGAKISMSEEEIEKDERVYGITYSEEERFFMRNQQIGEIDMISAATAEDALEAIYRIISIDHYQLVILDSIAQLLPQDEADAVMADGGMLGAALPRLIARFNRKLVDAYYQRPNKRPNLTSLVVTNQVTAAIGARTRPGMPPPEKQKAGYSLRHAKFLSLKLRSSKSSSMDISEGHEVNWSVDKGKAGTHNGLAGTFDYRKKSGVFGPDYEKESLSEGIRAGVIGKHPGAYYDCPYFGIDRVKGVEALTHALREADPEWFFSIYYEVMKAHGIHTTTRWEE